MADVSTYDMAVDLAETLNIRNVHWTDWERGFIETFSTKVLNGEEMTFSKRQQDKIQELWDKL